MDLKKEYETLYQHWLEEFEQIDLTPLTQDLFNNYKKCVKFINNIEEFQKEDLINQLLKSYQENFKYLLNDFLKMREIKIINSALALKEIDLNNVIEAEKLFYRNLIGSIKGFKKIKALSILDEEIDEYIKDMKEPKKIEGIKAENVKETIQKEVIIDSELKFKKKEEDFNYILIRFLKNTPPLVGVDLKSYGPFEKEDLANIPLKNAKILINERFADKIDI